MINRKTVIKNTIFDEKIIKDNNNLEIEYNITFIKEKLNYDDINLAFNSIKQELEFSIVSLKFDQLLHQYGIPVEVTTGNIKFVSETVVILRSTLLPTSIPTMITVKQENSNKSNSNKTNLTPLYVFIALLGFILFISFFIIYYYYETYEHKRLIKIYLNSTYEKTVENNVDNITTTTATNDNNDDVNNHDNDDMNNHDYDDVINHNNNTDRSYMNRMIETIFPAVVLKANDEILIETTQILSPLTYDNNPTSTTTSDTATITTSPVTSIRNELRKTYNTITTVISELKFALFQTIHERLYENSITSQSNTKKNGHDDVDDHFIDINTVNDNDIKNEIIEEKNDDIMKDNYSSRSYLLNNNSNTENLNNNTVDHENNDNVIVNVEDEQKKHLVELSSLLPTVEVDNNEEIVIMVEDSNPTQYTNLLFNSTIIDYVSTTIAMILPDSIANNDNNNDVDGDNHDNNLLGNTNDENDKDVKGTNIDDDIVKNDINHLQIVDDLLFTSPSLVATSDNISFEAADVMDELLLPSSSSSTTDFYNENDDMTSSPMSIVDFLSNTIAMIVPDAIIDEDYADADDGNAEDDAANKTVTLDYFDNNEVLIADNLTDFIRAGIHQSDLISLLEHDKIIVHDKKKIDVISNDTTTITIASTTDTTTNTSSDTNIFTTASAADYIDNNNIKENDKEIVDETKLQSSYIKNDFSPQQQQLISSSFPSFASLTTSSLSFPVSSSSSSPLLKSNRQKQTIKKSSSKVKLFQSIHNSNNYDISLFSQETSEISLIQPPSLLPSLSSTSSLLPPPSSSSQLSPLLPPPQSSSLSPSFLPPPSSSVDLINWLFPMSDIVNTNSIDGNHSDKNDTATSTTTASTTTTSATATLTAATVSANDNDTNDFQQQNNNTIPRGIKKKKSSSKMNLFKLSNKDEEQQNIIIPYSNTLSGNSSATTTTSTTNSSSSSTTISIDPTLSLCSDQNQIINDVIDDFLNNKLEIQSDAKIEYSESNVKIQSEFTDDKQHKDYPQKIYEQSSHIGSSPSLLTVDRFISSSSSSLKKKLRKSPTKSSFHKPKIIDS